MKNTFGSSVTLTLFGESHGAAVGAVIDGLAPGIRVDTENIAQRLSRRRPSGPNETARHEPDEFQILSGVFNGRTTGTPLCIVIPNVNTRSSDYSYGQARPSHADYSAFCKYHGYEDYRGGGHFSGRITAAAVAAGAIFLSALDGLNIGIATHILRCGSAEDRGFENVRGDIALLENAAFPVLDSACAAGIEQEISRARSELDSIGGITQTAVCGLPAGLGEPWFDSVESMISHAVFGIGGIKGIEFGGGFGAVCGRGSQFNDAFRMKNGTVVTESNNNGGINGGITNGMPVIFSCAVKPTPSIAAEQKSVDFITGENISLSVCGRHDPAIIRRICPVIDSITALVVCDMLAQRYGTDVFLKGAE